MFSVSTDKNSISEQKFSDRLRRLREKELNRTLSDFAAAIRVSKGYVSDLERGVKLNPSKEFVEKVCNAYGVSREWLENGVGEPFGAKEDFEVARNTFDLRGLSTPNLDQVFDFMLADYRDPKKSREDKHLALSNIAAVADELRRRSVSSTLPADAQAILDAVEKAADDQRGKP